MYTVYIAVVLAVTIIGSASAACNLRASWASTCRNPQMVAMNDEMKQALLDIHNKKRNEIALGQVPNYDPAANMATLQWDDGLAANAELNVRQCEMRHDKCTTDQYPYSGQNLAMYMTSASTPQKSPAHIANMAGGQWFDKEQVNGQYYGWMPLINNFNPGDTSQHQFLHFTQYIWATADRIGCAASTSTRYQSGRDWSATWLACDYSYGNMIGSQVYQVGSPASQCETGPNDNYPGLCSENEQYNN
jgi:hypothetical protein